MIRLRPVPMRGEPSAPPPDPPVVHAVTAFAAATALCLAFALPLTYLWSARDEQLAEMRATAQLHAAAVSQIVSRNPDFWRFENARIRGMLAISENPDASSQLRVVDNAGYLVADLGERVAAPSHAVEHPIFESGRHVGRVELERSLRGVLRNTFIMAAFSSLLAFIAYMALRTLPLRMMRRALARAAHLATHDALTGLPNRTLFRDRLVQALAANRGRRGEAGVIAVLCIDLDHFKDVNDTLGHAAGDTLLREAGRRLRACLRESDTLARLGGDEFAVILRAQQPQDAERLARRLIDALTEPFDLGDLHATVGASLGIAIATPSGAEGSPAQDPDQLLQEADIALYRAKEAGRGTFRFFEQEMNLRLRERKALEQDLRVAIAEGQFQLLFQPQIDLDSGRIAGAEALLRWHHPGRGEVPPGSFIPIAEDTGLIMVIGEWVLREACREAAAWPSHLRVAVNVSSVQFRQSRLLDAVRTALDESGLAPHRLELEVTEGVLLQDSEETLAILDRLKTIGVAIAIDDFGTGYCSLAYLQRFRFDRIKIDGEFVRGLGTDAHASAIVRAVIGISHALGLRVTAEGVETERHLSLLLVEGCTEAQGFHIGRPMPAAQIHAMASLSGHAGPRDPVLL